MTEKIVSVETLAGMVQGEVIGDKDALISGFAPLDGAGKNDITFLAKANRADLLDGTEAGAAIVPDGVDQANDLPLIRVRDPYLAVAIIHSFLLEKPFEPKGVHPRAMVGEGCRLGENITVGPLAVLGSRVTLGERVTIGPGAVIGDGVTIGDDSIIHANVSIYEGCTIGSGVIIHSGTVIGSDGYGYSANERGEHVKRPQVGTVRIDDNVEIGANCCVDRAAYGVTWIKSGTKIDNLVQIAHNVIIGENSLLVSQVGISGSTTLGRNVVMGGQSATAGHLTLGDRVMVAARGGVHNDHPEGAVLGGAPAFPVKQWAKACAVFARLPELQTAVRKHGRALKELQKNSDIEK